MLYVLRARPMNVSPERGNLFTGSFKKLNGLHTGRRKQFDSKTVWLWNYLTCFSKQAIFLPHYRERGVFCPRNSQIKTIE